MNTGDKVIIRMQAYIQELLSKVPEDMGGVESSPEVGHLLLVNDQNPELLDKETAQICFILLWLSCFFCQK
jgi:hypothetical protein